jgi:TonB family protein
MNRLQKKCFIVSAGMHSLLVVILVVAPALGSKSKMEEMPPIDFIPNKTIDAAFSGGGNPNTRPPPPAPPAPPAPAPPQREVAPPEPKPEPKPEVIKTHDPEPPKEVVKPKPVTESLEVQQKPKRSKPEVTTKAVPRTSDSEKKQKQKAEADARAKELAETRAKETADARRRHELAAAIGSATRSLKTDLTSTPIDVNPGPGGGGEAYANYAQVVKSIYERSWIPSDDTTSDEAITKVSVTIRRDGSVASARIIKRCGDASIDQSVQRTLDRVKFIAPFPDGTKDQERTFTINFNLKAKRMMG